MSCAAQKWAAFFIARRICSLLGAIEGVLVCGENFASLDKQIVRSQETIVRASQIPTRKLH